MPTFGSLFAGIGGFDLGLERAGWTNIWQVEIDEWRSQILERHWPESPRWGDIRTFPPFEDADWEVDLICGGFPCQDLSTAGKRAGIRGKQSSLFFEFARVVGLLRPRWLLVENVPGLLSSHEGKDMGIVLETLSELGYGLAWRVLDSQYFGVPQRRRRVYIVGHLGAPCPPEILFESESRSGDSPAGGEAGERITGPLIGGSGSGGIRRAAPGQSDEASYYMLTGFRNPESSGANTLGAFRSDTAPTLDQEGLHAIAFANRTRQGVKVPEVIPGGITPALTNPGAGGRADAINVAAPLEAADGHHGRSSPRGDGADNLIAGTVTGAETHCGNSNPIPDNYVCTPPDADGVREATGVSRRLDPCPRCADGRRYAALGDAVTVNVVEWIGRRLMEAYRNTR